MNQIEINPLNTQQPPEENLPQAGSFNDEVDWLSIIQFAGSSLILLLILGFSGILAFFALIGGTLELTFPILINQIVIAILVIPSIWLSFKKIAGTNFSFVGQRGEDWYRKNVPLLILILFPLWLIGGVSASSNGNSLFLAIISSMLVLGSTLWVLWFASRKLPESSGQRSWGLLTTGMTIAPWLVIALNIIGLLIILMVIGFGLMDNEWVLAEFNKEIVYFQTFNPSVEEITTRVEEWISLDGIRWQLFLYLAVLTPILEEFFKVIGLWFISKKVTSPADGLRAGMLVGAGFTIVESLSAGAEPEGWAFTMGTRMLVGLIHITASGLLGYGLAKRWLKGEYWKLIFYYGAAILLHGAWNGFVVTLGMNSMFSQNSDPSLALGENFLPFIFGTICFTLVSLFLLNFLRKRSLRTKEIQQESISQELN